MGGSISAFIEEYDRDVLEFVGRGIDCSDEERFDELALRAFELQYRTKKSFREYCKRKSVSSETIDDWQDIPAVSSFPFKKILDNTFPARKAEGVYVESGIVELRKKRGPFFPDERILALVTAGNRLLEKSYVFPDIKSIRMLFMVPVPRMAPGMVMSTGLERMRQRFGTDDSRFLITFRGLNLKRLIVMLYRAEKTGEPIALLGATWGFDYFFNACRKAGMRFRLPEGSRIVDSGGYVGRYMKCTNEEFFQKCGEIFGIEEDHCINALWLCESSTVYFDNALKNALAGVKRARYKEIPPWCRTIVVDPVNFQRLPKGQPGLLRHYDLTNRGMAVAVQTDKMGYETEDGFEVLGKWNRDMKAPDIERKPQHPGGRLVSRVMDSFLDWKFSKIERIYRQL
jgi:anaerobic magnesium-protoporphyrin IX monomethyl ester cyclase